MQSRQINSNTRDPAFTLSLERLNRYLSSDGHVIAQSDLDYALVWHAAHGCIDVCGALLDAGADIQATVESYFNSTPLRSATVHGEDMARYLLTRGADARTHGVVLTAGLYGHLGLLKLLVLAGADFESPVNGETPVQAIRERCEEPTRDAIIAFLETEAKSLRPAPVDVRVESAPVVASEAINSSAPSQCDVMISYCWDQKSIMRRVAAALRAHSYNVWLDVDHMTGSTLEAMAGAIESAEVIIMGISRGYKNSTNCRLEAEYAAIKKKRIIPLMVEPQYRCNQP